LLPTADAAPARQYVLERLTDAAPGDLTGLDVVDIAAGMAIHMVLP
jgi:hypothetical protein